ncbi:retrovirus-related pol polyprotein from transposon TNT 1-94 [Tanacetum coccineum]
MSTQQDIYAVGSENRPPMLNKENYVPWSSCLLKYAKRDADHKVPVNETLHEQTDDELTEKELKQIEADDQAIQTNLLGLPEDIYATVDSCETAQEIWLRVQQMMKGFDIGIQEKKAKLFNKWERFTYIDGESTESNYHRFSKLMNGIFKEKIKLFQKRLQQIAQPGMNMGQDRHMQMVGGYGGNQFRQFVQNAFRTGVQNVGNQNGLIIECYIYRGVGHLVRNCTVRPRKRDVAYLQTQLLIAQKEEVRIQLQQASTSDTQIDKAPVYDSDGSAEALELEIERLLREVVSQDIMSIVQSNYVIDTSNLQTELDHTKERFENYIIKKENEYAKLWNDWYKKCEECKYNIISYDKAYNDMQQKIERLQAQLGDKKGKSKDTPSVSNTLDPLHQKLKNENVELEFQVSEQKDTTKGTSVNTQFCKQSILGKPPSSSKPKLYVVTPFLKSKGLPKIDETHALSKPITSNSVPILQESKVVKNDNVIASGMFRINQIKLSREEKYVPKKAIASVRTNPIIVSQPHVITKKDVNSDSNGLSSIGIDNTAKTRRPQPKSNTKNDRVPSASKSSCSKNKEVEVEEHPRNLLLSKNKKHMSSECNNIKLAIWNDKFKVVCAMCKQCLITANHDVCVLNYVNDMNYRGKKQKANVSNTEKKKQKPKVMKPKKVGLNERLASPKPSKPRSCLRWSPTRRLFDQKGKIIASSEYESQSDCSNGYLNLFMVRRLGLFQAYDRESKDSHQFRLEVLGTIRFGNDHVAAILGFGDLQWGNILITRVAFRRNTCFVKNLEGVDLLKGNRTTNLYTINLHEMAFASPICLMARAISTKSWLWHQRLSHLNFDTINNIAKNDLVTSLPKFKYHKEYLCPLCDQGKSKRAPHPPKPVPNSKQRLHLLHMDLCGPMRIAIINRKRVLLQSPVIIIRTDNGTKFKNQILKEYFDGVGISHQASSVRTPQQNGVVERRNQTLVEATTTMLIFSHV